MNALPGHGPAALVKLVFGVGKPAHLQAIGGQGQAVAADYAAVREAPVALQKLGGEGNILAVGGNKAPLRNFHGVTLSRCGASRKFKLVSLMRFHGVALGEGQQQAAGKKRKQAERGSHAQGAVSRQ